MSRPDSEWLPPSPPPGWYFDGDLVRWWDGSQWGDPVPTRGPARHAVLWIGLAVVAGIVIYAGSLVAYAYFSGKAHDARSLDEAAIRDIAAQACASLTTSLENATGTRSERIDIGNVAIGRLVAEMNTIDSDTLRDDPPAIDWIADWQRLAVARTDFRSILASAANPQFAVPLTEDGYPITGRMTDVAPEECTRAIELAARP